MHLFIFYVYFVIFVCILKQNCIEEFFLFTSLFIYLFLDQS